MSWADETLSCLLTSQLTSEEIEPLRVEQQTAERRRTFRSDKMEYRVAKRDFPAIRIKDI